jgi:Tol biopolymer transport system component
MWLPDNRSLLAFVIEIERGGWAIYKIDSVTGETHLVRHFASPPQGLSVSPDGKMLFYSTYDPDDPQAIARLMRLEIATGQEVEIKRGEWSTSLAVSPDGKELAYIASDPASRSSYVAIMPLNGANSREVYRSSQWWGASRYGTLSWTPDQKSLLFVRAGESNGSVNTIWRVPAAGGTAEQIRGLSMAGTTKNPQLHPDGRRVFFSASLSNPQEVWALENFLPNGGTKK